MCTGSNVLESLFTDAEYCFVGRDLKLYACWCPFSTCIASRCEFTPLTLVVAVVFSIVGVAAAAAYILASSALSDVQSKQDAENAVGTHHYRDVLFGVYQASSEAANTSVQHQHAPPTRETTQLLGGSQKLANKGGGTF
jgi:hypothetical protein